MDYPSSYNLRVSNKRKTFSVVKITRINLHQDLNKKSTGRKRGVANYNYQIVYEMVKKVRPETSKGWNLVAQDYQNHLQEEYLRDGSDIKRTFFNKMCNGFKKVTGLSQPAQLTHKSQLLWE